MRLGARARGTRMAPAKAWLEFLSSVDPYARKDEQVALKGARLFADYLKAARAEDHVLHTTGPGRFLMPGDLEGSPLLTFCPLPLKERALDPARLARRHDGAALREL